ncbi:hypothetical protein [Thomasclavelia cocleata]|uniref:hypothetical protein n=1 Tax=Thomasclavelia cocleata TaxID=69824 RepID=UPI00241D7165|nr:hypothetical protein [Thomasclavelia cocleata]
MSFKINQLFCFLILSNFSLAFLKGICMITVFIKINTKNINTVINVENKLNNKIEIIDIIKEILNNIFSCLL